MSSNSNIVRNTFNKIALIDFHNAAIIGAGVSAATILVRYS